MIVDAFRGVVCGAAAAIGHGFGVGEEVEKGEKRPIFAKMGSVRDDPHFQPCSSR